MAAIASLRNFLMFCIVSILATLEAACPPGWLTWQDSCYIFLPKQMNWFDASKACDRPGVSLVFPNSMKEQIFVWEKMKTRMEEVGANQTGANIATDLQLWIDCYRNDAGHFECSGNDWDTILRNWGEYQPTNVPEEKCVRMAETFGGKWGDEKCQNQYFVSCEMRAVGNGCRRSSPHYIHVPQQCLLNHLIKSYPVKESIGCGLACWAEPLCRSFNLWKQADNKNICQLNYASRMEVNITDIKYEENCYFYEP